MREKTLWEHINEMRNLGDTLVEYSFPIAPPDNEDVLMDLKQRKLCVDGYNVLLHYNKSDYENHFLETLQVIGMDFPYLPFQLVCKCAMSYLGNKQLSFTELWRGDRNIYIWNLMVDDRGRPLSIKISDKQELHSYEGLEFSYVDPNSVNFF